MGGSEGKAGSLTRPSPPARGVCGHESVFRER
jgi:hypothetical protein